MKKIIYLSLIIIVVMTNLCACDERQKQINNDSEKQSIQDSNYEKDIKNNLRFILPIGIGVFIGVFLVGNLLKIAFDKFFMEDSFAVIGLILRKFKTSY